jgi:nucleoid-associated protein YgaU
MIRTDVRTRTKEKTMTAALFEAPLHAVSQRSQVRPVYGSQPKMAHNAVRLTARGRRVVASVVGIGVLSAAAGVVLILSAVFGGSVAASTSHVSTTDTSAVVVKAGESLWQIAQRVDPSGDPRDVMEQIAELNGFDSGTHLQVGQVIHVPVIK